MVLRNAKAGPVVEREIGGYPVLWDRSAVFIANLFSLFFGNTQGTEVLRREVGSIETYGGRLIPILDLVFAKGGNLLVLEGKPDPVLCGYFLEDLGLSLPELGWAGHEDYLGVLGERASFSEKTEALVALVGDHPSEWLDGFVTDDALVRLAELTGKKLTASRDGSYRGNNKYLLHQFLAERGLPVFDTWVAADEAEVRARVGALRGKGYRQAVVKAQIGASGIGMYRLQLDEETPVPDYLFHEGPCLVQGWLEAADGIQFLGSPSVQMFLRDERVSLFDVTDQILSHQSVHEGNMAPPPYLELHPELEDELLGQAETTALWLHEQGYRGTASADFHVVRRNDACEVRLCEVNARITGATYPSLLARLFRPRGAWLMRNIRFTHPYASRLILDALQEACLLFQRESASGILPINFNLSRDGNVAKGQFLAIGADLDEVRSLFRAVRNLESILWEYDRD